MIPSSSLSRIRFIFACFLVLGAAAATAAEPRETADVVRLAVWHEPQDLRPGDPVRLILRIEIQPGWHLQAHAPEAELLVPTEWAFDPHPFFELASVDYPPAVPSRIEILQDTPQMYHGEITLTAHATIAPSASPGQTIKPASALIAQACSDELCLRPSTMLVTPALHVGPSGLTAHHAATPLSGLAWPQQAAGGLLLLWALLGGLALNLTPCVYPMIPVTVAFFAGQAAGRVGRALVLSSVYVLGISVTYAILGVAASQTGALFGSWLRHPVMLIGMSGIILALSLSLFGFYELQPPAWMSRRLAAARSGLAGAFAMGLVVGFMATPCIGPFVLGLLLYVAHLGNPWLGFWLFFLMGIGMGLPFVVIGTASSRLAQLPKAGPWLVWTKRLLGAALCGVALYFVRPLLPGAAFHWLLAVALGVAAAYLGWLEPTRLTGAWLAVRRAVGLGLAGAAVIVLPMWSATQRPAIDWQPYADARLAQASRDGRPALVDIYADWCLPCVELDHVTFRHPSVVERLHGRIATLRIDATGTIPPEADALIERSGVYGVPSVLFFDAAGRERPELRAAGFVTPDQLLKILDQLEQP